MSELVNTEAEIKLELKLYFNPSDIEWANYTIKVYRKIESEWILSDFLSLLDKEILFLDIYYDNEVLKFINNIGSLMKQSISEFEFTPCDEKEFKLICHASNSSDDFRIHYSTYKSSSTDIIFRVSKIGLQRFLDELESENKILEKQLSQHIWNQKYNS